VKDFWNERYGADDYAYGTLPNEFLKETLEEEPAQSGSILFPAEGEGRNAVYAAKKGWKVAAFDMSEEGRKKALRLAQGQNVEIDYTIARLQDFDFGEEKYDAISFIYVHMGPDIRSLVHEKAVRGLKKGGRIILEAFSKKQLGKDSGGPKNIDWLYSAYDLIADFDSLNKIDISEVDTFLEEGPYHLGLASVIRLIGTKTI